MSDLQTVVSVATLKAFGTDYLGADGVVMAENASKARYRFYLSCKDAGYEPEITKIRVFRLPDFDNGKTRFGKAEPGMCYCSDFMIRGQH